ncbi:hypothetical protein DSECCO2_655740 [anaerobic digester metagenome]
MVGSSIETLKMFLPDSIGGMSTLPVHPSSERTSITVAGEVPGPLFLMFMTRMVLGSRANTMLPVGFGIPPMVRSQSAVTAAMRAPGAKEAEAGPCVASSAISASKRISPTCGSADTAAGSSAAARSTTAMKKNNRGDRRPPRDVVSCNLKLITLDPSIE